MKHTTFVVEFRPTKGNGFEMTQGRITSDEPITVRQSNAANEIIRGVKAVLDKNGFKADETVPKTELDEANEKIAALKEDNATTNRMAKALFEALEAAVKDGNFEPGKKLLGIEDPPAEPKSEESDATEPREETVSEGEAEAATSEQGDGSTSEAAENPGAV